MEKSLLNVNSPSEYSSTVTITEERYSRMENLQLQMQQLMVDQQTIFLQQTVISTVYNLCHKRAIFCQ